MSKPEVRRDGLFLPWGVVIALVLSGLIPLWVLSVKAYFVAEVVAGVVENDKRQDRELTGVKERIARIEGSKP